MSPPEAPRRRRVSGPAAAIIAGLVLYSILTAAFVIYETNAAAERSCAAIVQLANRTPPAGNPATNPSRAYDQGLHASFGLIASAEGCR